MMDEINDGGPAFPRTAEDTLNPITDMSGDIANAGMSLRDYFAIRAPDPSNEEINMQMQFDISRNPHNDYHKAPRRSKFEIIAQHKFAYADAMIKARGQSNG